jgi:K+-transporting ATPase ATPase C chain
MLAHLRANLWLLGLTVLLCSVAYPLALWAIGQAAFNNHANGSLVYGKDGKPVASRLIAHEVKGDQYFQPRPSATVKTPWNAAASGASNWAANNYQLRDRVARALAPVVKYGKGPRQGQPVAPDVVKWFREERPGLVAEWAEAHSGLAEAWVKAEDAAKEFVRDWFKQHPNELEAWIRANLAAWKKKNPGRDHPEPEDLARAFFQGFSRIHPATWLAVVETKDEKDAKGEPVKRVALVEKGDEDSADIAAVFFDLWRDAHPDVALEEVPADQVMASASGLDPHITLRNALYQLERVAGKWAELTGQAPARLRVEIEALVRRHASAPMFGLAGVELVNVVEVNLALHEQYGDKVKKEK